MKSRAEKLIFNVELRDVRTQLEFQKEFGKHFRIDPDHAKFWHSFGQALLYMPTACTFRFHGWSDFEKHMPRYSRRLRQMIRSWQKATREETYKIEYL